MAKSGSDYKWVGVGILLHPQEVTGGRMLEPGETVTLDADAVADPHNAALIEDGGLIPVGATTPKEE